MTEILRYAAFASTPGGGNPAGIVLAASELSDDRMQQIAAEVGYAETAFVTDPSLDDDPRHLRLRYFSPTAEVPFCGHATIATAVVLAEKRGVGSFAFETPVGPVRIETSEGPQGITATFESVTPVVEDFSGGVLRRLLSLLGIVEGQLDARYPPRLSFAGNRHPILVVADREDFDRFTFDPGAMRTLMDEQGWLGTVTILFAVSATEFRARNLFPVGVITEDPATGSAAASLGGYLRALGLAIPPVDVVVTQGSHVGRPSVLLVGIPASGGIRVTGGAVEIA